MTHGIETLDIVEPWLIALLKGASLVDHVVNAQTAEAIKPPYLLVSQISSRDILGVGTIRIDTDSIYMIKVIHQVNSFIPGRATMQAVDDLLHGVTATTSNGSVTCIRETMFHYPETVDGVQFMHVGANYRIRASATSDETSMLPVTIPFTIGA